MILSVRWVERQMTLLLTKERHMSWVKGLEGISSCSEEEMEKIAEVYIKSQLNSFIPVRVKGGESGDASQLEPVITYKKDGESSQEFLRRTGKWELKEP